MKWVIANNKRAKYDYFILEKLEAGICLTGNEIKSIREKGCSINGAYCDIRNGEAFILGMNIPAYEMGTIFNTDPMRERKLLLHKREIKRLLSEKEKKGFTVVPLSVYLTDGKAKVKIGLCKGKKVYDKRESIKKRDIERNIAKAK